MYLSDSRLSIHGTGSQAGTIVAYPMAAAIIMSMGWEAVFYIQGCIGLVWCALWFLVVPETPSTDKRISKVELEYIMNAIGDTKDEKVRDGGKL